MPRHAPRHIVAAVVAAITILGTYQTAVPSHHATHVVVAPGQPGPRVGPSYLYPDPTATPGATNPDVTSATIHQTICKSGWTATVRPPASFTDALKAEQLSGAYAVRYAKDKDQSHYEEDHFIALEIGGAPQDKRNLWPEMWGSPSTPLTRRGPFNDPSIVGAKAKDKVETQLKDEVCAGTLTLKEAQDIIVTDWFKYYREKVLK